MGKMNLLDSMNGEENKKYLLKSKAYDVSNDLHKFGVRDAKDINDIVYASDYVLMKDPFKYSNWDAKVNQQDELKGLVVCQVIVGGRQMDFMINLNKDNGLNVGDICRIDLDKDGKEAQTTFSDDFLNQVGKKLQESGCLTKGITSQKDLAEIAEKLSSLDLRNYEDIVRQAAKGKGFQIDAKSFMKKEKAAGRGDEYEVEGDEKSKDGKEVADEDEEINIEEAAKTSGTSVEAIEKFCKEQGIDPSHIKGIKTTNEGKLLSKKIGTKVPDHSILLRINGIDGETKGFVIDEQGNTRYDQKTAKGESKDGNDVVLGLVETGDKGTKINDVEDSLEDVAEEKINEIIRKAEEQCADFDKDNIDDINSAAEIFKEASKEIKEVKKIYGIDEKDSKADLDIQRAEDVTVNKSDDDEKVLGPYEDPRGPKH